MRYNVHCPHCGARRSLPDYGLWPDGGTRKYEYPGPSEPQECLNCDGWMQIVPIPGKWVDTFKVQACGPLEEQTDETLDSMKNIHVTTATYHGLKAGDTLSMNGKQFRVTFATATTCELEDIPFYLRVWRKMVDAARWVASTLRKFERWLVSI